MNPHVNEHFKIEVISSVKETYMNSRRDTDRQQVMLARQLSDIKWELSELRIEIEKLNHFRNEE